MSYDPSEHTVAEVLQYTTEHPDERDDILEAEQAGQGRSTLVTQLEAQQQSTTGAEQQTEGETAPTEPPGEPEQSLPGETAVGDYVDYDGLRYKVTAIDEETATYTLQQDSEEGDAPEVTASAAECVNVSKYIREDGEEIDLTDGSEEYREQLIEKGVI